MKTLLTGLALVTALNGAVAAPDDVVLVQVPCVPSEAAAGFLKAEKAALVATDVFTNGKDTLTDTIWVSERAIFVLRSSKLRNNTCVLTELPVKGDI